MSQHLTPDGHVTPIFAAMLVRLAANYPTTGKLSEATIRSYAATLGDVPVRDLIDACARHLQHPASADEAKFFPSAPTIAAWAAATADDAAVLAWATFRRAAEDVGAYASIEVEDACAAHALVSVFGSWAAFCAAEAGPAEYARRQEFAAAYREACRRARMAVGATRLPGLCEGLGRYLGGPAAVVGRLTAGGRVRLEPDLAGLRRIEGGAP